ncbi:MAG: M23 family metallopeptidase [bacterium]|nr:M23 family metallopeptidase [bacterium]
MKKPFTVSLSALLLIVFTALTGHGETVSEAIDLENAIIIKGIHLEAEETGREAEHQEGEIIYDNSFDDGQSTEPIDPIGSIDSIKRKKIRRPVARKKHSSRSRFQKLKKKDSRWHLTRYRVRKNDNLWKIAGRYSVSHRLIIEVNNIKNPDRLLPGRYIDVPSRKGIYYTIKRGDTVSGIALKFDIDKQKIISHNKLRPNRIFQGKKLFLPGAKKHRPRRKNRKYNDYNDSYESYELYKKDYSGRNNDKVARKKRVKRNKTRISFTWPVKGPLTSTFGRRLDPFSKKRKFHCGIDISANIGTPIKAAAAGRVIFSGWKEGYGKVVVIRHTNGYISVYAHNSKNLVKVKQKVKKRQKIARSGNTGAVTGAHLHFEIRKYLTPLNPLRLLPK